MLSFCSVFGARAGIRQLLAADWCALLSGTGTDIDKYVDPELLAQLRVPLIYTTSLSLSQQRCYNRRIMLVRSPRRWHGRKGTFFLPPFRYQASCLTTLHDLKISPLLKSSWPKSWDTLLTFRSTCAHLSLGCLSRHTYSPFPALDGTTTDADYPTFDAMHAHIVCSSP